MAFFARWKREWCPYLTILSVAFSFVLSCILAYRVAEEIVHYYTGGWPLGN